MKKFLFIYPPFEGKVLLKHRTPFPIGPLYITSYLENKGIEAEVYDFCYPYKKHKTDKPLAMETNQRYFRFGWSDKEILSFLKKNLKKYNDTVFVSSLMSSTYNGAYKVIDFIKHVNKKTVVVIGGPHATAFPEHVVKYSKADYVCMGEGEVEVYNFITKGDSSGIIHRDKVGTNNIKKHFIKDMDTLPFINRKHLKDNRKFNNMIVTFSRGCPHKCSFCGSHLIQGRVWRHKTPQRAFEELEYYYNKWGITKFEIEDDNLCPGKKGVAWLEELCDLIMDSTLRLRLHIPHGIPVYATADKKFCDKIWKAGFRNLAFPLESTNIDTLKDMNKEFTVENWKKSAINWRKYEKINPAQIIIGYPFVDTIESMLNTIIDICEYGNLIWASHFRLNKGTPLFERCLESGLINKTYDPINTQSFYIETDKFNIKDLREIMQITKAVNYGIERGWRVFYDDPYKMKHSSFKFLKPTTNVGTTIAKGKFKFKRGQHFFAGLLLTRFGLSDKPKLSMTDSEIVYKGIESSKVYLTLFNILKRRKLFVDKNAMNKRGWL